MDLPTALQLLAPSALYARKGQTSPTLEACLMDLCHSTLPSTTDSLWGELLTQGTEPLEANHFGDVSLKRENIQQLDDYLRLRRVTSERPEHLLAYDLLIAREVISVTSELVRSQNQEGLAADTSRWLNQGLVSIARLILRQCNVEAQSLAFPERRYEASRPLNRSTGDLTSEELLDVWRRGHWVFYVLTQGLILALRRFKEALWAAQNTKPGDASQWEAARIELSSATDLLWASGAAMKLTGSFRAEQYHDVVRPTMTLNHPNSHVKLTSLSGTMTWDHHYLVQQVWRKELSLVLRSVPAQLAPDYEKFVEAYKEGLSVGHIQVCSQFVGQHLGSLVQPETPAVKAIASIDEKRLGMLRAPLIASRHKSESLQSPSRSRYPNLAEHGASRIVPSARYAERARLIEWGNIKKGNVVLDVQAADGYLADGVVEQFGPEVRCICLEPSGPHRSRIAKCHQTVADELDDFRSLADGSVDVVLGLVGLHHSPNLPRTLWESCRVLRKGGTVAFCEVLAGSSPALFLENYVHPNCTSGHMATFPGEGQMEIWLKEADMAEVYEKSQDVSWRFQSTEQIGIVFRGVFGLLPSSEEVLEAVRKYLGVSKQGQDWIVPWSLSYVRGQKLH